MPSIIDYRLKDFLLQKGKEILTNHFCYGEEGLRRFEYAFHIMFQDYLKEMREQKRGFWDNILLEVYEDPSKSSYFTGMLCGYQIMKTLQTCLEFCDQELMHFEQLFLKKVNNPIEKQAFERENY